MKNLQSTNALRQRSKPARVQHEILLRRRSEQFSVLTAIAERFPKSADKNEVASGTISAAALARHAGVSRKALGRALKHWQRWRVLWIHWRGNELRFERAVVEKILAARASQPGRVLPVLREHRMKREAASPWPRVPKTSSSASSQVAETAQLRKPS